MLPRFHWSDITTVGHYLGVLILLTGALMCVPALVAVFFGEMKQLSAFVLGIGVCAVAGSLLRLLKSYKLDRRRSLLLVGFSWIAIGIVASVPLMHSGEFVSPFDAIFDSVSALTTTGHSLASDIDSLSYSQTTWRVLLTFAGAQAVVVIAMYFGFFGEGAQAFFMEDRRGGERKRQRISKTWKLVGRVAGIFGFIGVLASTLVCLLLGLPPVDAFMNGFWLACDAVSTGGFVPHTSGLIYYHSLALDLVLCVLMLVGAISFGVYSFLRRGKFKQVRKNSELRTYLGWLCFLVIFVVFMMMRDEIITGITGLLANGMVTVISTATTCGMQTVYPEQIGISTSDAIVILLCCAALFGACAYSTGGGIKIVRVLQVLHWIAYAILSRLTPNNARIRVRYEYFGTRAIDSRDAMLAMTVCIMYLVTVALGSMFFIAHGNDALDSVLETIGYVSNCGITAGITQAGMSPDLKVVALLLMWLGRVEFVALIAAVVGIVLSLHPSNLFSNNRSKELREQKNKNRGGTAWRRRKGQKSSKSTGATFALVLLMTCSLVCVSVPAAKAVTLPDSGGAQVPVEEVPALSDTETYRQMEISALLSATKRQDNKKVAISGQAMGHAITVDADHKWVNLKSGNAMIGVYMTNELADEITQFGGYAKTGDTINVKGVYHLACDEHNGELEVHADEIEIVQQGAVYEVDWNLGVMLTGFLLIFVGFVIHYIRIVIRRGPRKKLSW